MYTSCVHRGWDDGSGILGLSTCNSNNNNIIIYMSLSRIGAVKDEEKT